VFRECISQAGEDPVLPAYTQGSTGSARASRVSKVSHSLSVEGTVKIVRSVKGEDEFSVLAHKAVIAETQPE